VSTAALSAVAFGAAGAVVFHRSRYLRDASRVRRRAREQVGLRPAELDHDSTSLTTVLSNPFMIGAVVAVVAMLLAGPVGMSAGVVPIVVRRTQATREQRKRSEALATQLAPTLQLIVGNLRIGRNVLASISEVTDTVAEPLGSLLREVVAEARLGTPVESVFQRVADREDDRHLNIVASALGLQARHGGSLVEILESVVDTIEEEDRLRRDIRSVTADGRMSAVVLLAMPPFSLAFVSLLNPGYAAPLVTEPLGRTMSIVGVVLGFTGWRWLKSLSNPEVTA
jgi:tight adherence protein B